MIFSTDNQPHRMNKIFLLLLCAALATGCRKDAKPPIFEMSYLNQEIEIPAGLNVFESHHFFIHDIPTAATNYLRLNNLEKEDIESILPKSCRFINIASSAGYDFLYEVSVRIFSKEKPELKYEIFYDDLISERTGTVLNLIPNDNSVKDLLLNNSYSLEIILKQLRDTPREFIRTRIELTFEVR